MFKPIRPRKIVSSAKGKLGFLAISKDYGRIKANLCDNFLYEFKKVIPAIMFALISFNLIQFLPYFHNTPKIFFY